jgi:hypothetical protein
MSDQRELISISLEIVAFFFVTIDLYGEVRLEAATKAFTARVAATENAIVSGLRGWAGLKPGEGIENVVGLVLSMTLALDAGLVWHSFSYSIRRS